MLTVLGVIRPEPPASLTSGTMPYERDNGNPPDAIGRLACVSIRQGEGPPSPAEDPYPEQGGGPATLLLRLRARIRANPMLNTTWRLLVLAAGGLVLLGGLIMLIGPGPGIVAIVLGLAILATEFAWAQHLLHRAKETAERAKDKAFDPRKRRRNQILLGIAVVLAVVAIVAYLRFFGLTLPWELLKRP